MFYPRNQLPMPTDNLTVIWDILLGIPSLSLRKATWEPVSIQSTPELQSLTLQCALFCGNDQIDWLWMFELPYPMYPTHPSWVEKHSKLVIVFTRMLQQRLHEVPHLNEIDMFWYLIRFKDPVLEVAEVAEVPHWRCTEVRCNQCAPSPPRRVGGRSTKDTPPSHKSHRHKLFTWLPIKPPKSTSQVINQSSSLPSDSFRYSGWNLGFATVRRTYPSYWNFLLGPVDVDVALSFAD